MATSPDSPSGTFGAGSLVGVAWEAAPCPALVLDREGCVVEANATARALLAEAGGGGAVPGWLSAAHRRVTAGSPRPVASGSPAPVPQAASGPLPHEPAGPPPQDASAPASGQPSGWVGQRSFAAHAAPVADGSVAWWLVDDTDRRLAHEALRGEQERTALLAEAATALLSSLNVSRCMELTARMAAEHLADAAVLVSPAQGRRHPLSYAQAGRPVTHAMLRVDSAEVPGLAEALQGFPPVPTRWINPHDVPGWAVPPGFAGPVGSVIVTPLPGHGVPGGALILLRSGSERAFSEGEEVFARLFAARAGAALSAARLYAEQAGITATLLRELLPPVLSGVHGVEYAGSYRPSKDSERIGGDFYDLHPAADPTRESLLVLGDVAGKGLDAAVLTGKIRNTLHALLPLADDHERVLNLLNGALLSSHHTRFATLVLASARSRAGQVHLRLTSAGHPAPLIVRTDGSVEEVPTRGTLVGALPVVSARTARVVLAPGDTCLLYTDGITEARGGPLGGRLFAEDRLMRALGECAALPAGAVVERIQMLAAQWLGQGGHDDMAAVAIHAPRAGAPRPVGVQAAAGAGDPAQPAGPPRRSRPQDVGNR